MRRTTGPAFMTWFVYILRCSDGSYYVGSTNDMEQRVADHNCGKGAQHTKTRLPVCLVYFEEYESRTESLVRERQIKKWSRAKKEALASGNAEKLKKLSKSRDSLNLCWK